MEEKDKKTKILEAARDVFFRKSYYEATMEEVSDISGVKKSTIYYYYPSKLELVFEVVNDGVEEIFSNLERIILEKDNIRDRIHEISEFYISLFKKNLKLFVILQRVGYDFMQREGSKDNVDRLFKKFKEIKYKLGDIFGEVTLSTGKKVSGSVFLGSIVSAFGRLIFENISQNKIPKEDEFKEVEEIFFASVGK